MPVLDSTCFLGLSQSERREQLYLALGGTDDGCILGLPLMDQYREILELIGSEACIFTQDDFWAAWLLHLDPDACTGMPEFELQAAVYALLYAEAGDDSLPAPECFLGLGPDAGLGLIAEVSDIIQQGGEVDVFSLRIVDEDTVALFHFNEGSGSSSEDAVEDYSAVLNNAEWVPIELMGLVGYSLNFNGVDSSVTVAGLLNIWPEEGAIMLKFRPSVNLPIVGEFTRLFQKVNIESGNHERLDSYFDPADGKLNILFRDSTTNYIIKSSRTEWLAGTDYDIEFVWGPGGMKMYVDGELDDWIVIWGLPGNGSFRQFIIGASNYDGVVDSVFPGLIDEFLIKNREPLAEEVEAYHTRYEYRPGINMSGRLGDLVRTNVVEPTGIGNEENLVLEPNVLVDSNGDGRIYYTGYKSDPLASQIFLATTEDGVNILRIGAIMGEGVGGEAGRAACSNVFKSGGVYYMFYSQSYGPLARATSLDGTTWNSTGVVIAADAQPWFVGIVNSFVFDYDTPTWKLLFEGYAFTGGLHWETGLATSTDQGQTWTLDADNPVNGLNFRTGIASVNCGFKRGSTYYYFYHGGVRIPSPPAPNFIAFATSTDLKNWTKYELNPVFTIYDETFPGGKADQVADWAFAIQEDTGLPYTGWGGLAQYYDVDRNIDTTGVDARIDRVVFPHSLDDLFALPADRIRPPAVTVNVSNLSFEVDWNSVSGASGYRVRLDRGSWIDVGTATSYNSSGIAGNHTITVVGYTAAGITGRSKRVPFRLSAVGPEYEAEILAWVAEVEDNEGAVDTSVIDAHNDFVVTAKAQGFWNNILYWLPLVGTFPASQVPLIHTIGDGVVSLNGFVEGDYDEFTGYTGDGASKSISTGVALNQLTAGNVHLAVYGVNFEETGTACLMGIAGPDPAFQGVDIYSHVAAVGRRFYSDNDSASPASAVQAADFNDGFLIGSQTATNVTKLYSNGVEVGSSSNTTGAFSIATEVELFAVNLNGTPLNYSAFSGRGFLMGTAIPADKIAAYNNAMTTLQTALGRNV